MTASSRQLKNDGYPAFAGATAGRQAVAPWESFGVGLANSRSALGQLRMKPDPSNLGRSENYYCRQPAPTPTFRRSAHRLLR